MNKREHTVPASDDQRIRSGLKFLTKADRRFIKAAAQLEKLAGVSSPPSAGDLLHKFRFEVAGNRYKGRMTQEQHDSLVGHQGSLFDFANAIADLILILNNALLCALDALTKGWEATKVSCPAIESKPDVSQVIGGVATGCCTYDTNLQKNGVTQSFCESGLQGHWDPQPCKKQPGGGES
jgi:hypothetical protein